MVRRTWLGVTIALGVLAFCSPVIAAKTECNEETISKLNSEVEAMQDGENKTKAMAEIVNAREYLAKNNKEGCVEHLKAVNYFIGKK